MPYGSSGRDLQTPLRVLKFRVRADTSAMQIEKGSSGSSASTLFLWLQEPPRITAQNDSKLSSKEASLRAAEAAKESGLCVPTPAIVLALCFTVLNDVAG
jgi:hypothetical protein